MSRCEAAIVTDGMERGLESLKSLQLKGLGTIYICHLEGLCCIHLAAWASDAAVEKAGVRRQCL